ncbi:multidrug and toxin extrusion protein 1-like [Syngnathus typhle]|uniref:multidrug and toxin extrusion protein 1-like n=1 Tax=Syngnathus typhle TaxID=161592 RepID=UPI002A698CD0|nr:multidrug and toxin extrusion protein 1-like [Syngnathus typhle]
MLFFFSFFQFDTKCRISEWGPFVKLATPSMLILCLEWWLFEVGGFIAGIISEIELGAQSVTYQLTVVAYMFPLGISAAVSVRVGNALGAGNIEQAKLSSKVSIICAFIVAFFVGLTITLAKSVIGYIFTSDLEILKRVAEILIVFVFLHHSDAVAGVCGGVIRGVGKQKVGALCNLVGHYFIGFPIGLALTFAAKLNILGLWIGLTLCVFMQATFLLVYLYKLDWSKAAEKAKIRAGVQVPYDDTVKTEDCKFESNTNQDPVTCPTSRCESASEGQQLPDQPKTPTTNVLTVKQLLLKRSLILLIFVAILAAGIIVRHFLDKLLQ